jgi:hypothetical protein
MFRVRSVEFGHWEEVLTSSDTHAGHVFRLSGGGSLGGGQIPGGRAPWNLPVRESAIFSARQATLCPQR